jgi:hypothetical protein
MPPATFTSRTPATTETIAGDPSSQFGGLNYSLVRVVQNGLIATVGGGGAQYMGDNGPATGAAFDEPAGLAADESGNIYIADLADNVIRKVSAGIITTVAGNGFGAGAATCGYSGDNGPATSAELCWSNGVAVDPAGNLYIADSANNVVRRVSGGVITTFAGNGFGAGGLDCGYSGDGGKAIHAELCRPNGVAADASGNVYIADSYNNVIRKVSKGIITTFAGKIAVEWPAYGRPRMTKELRERGWTVNPKRVYRLMREDNLLCVRKRDLASGTYPTSSVTAPATRSRSMIAKPEKAAPGVDRRTWLHVCCTSPKFIKTLGG